MNLSVYGCVSKFRDTDPVMVEAAIRQLSLLFEKEDGTIDAWRRLFGRWKEGMQVELDVLGISKLSLGSFEMDWDCAKIASVLDLLENRRDGGIGRVVDLGEHIGKRKLLFADGAPTQVLMDLCSYGKSQDECSKVVYVYPVSEKHERVFVTRELYKCVGFDESKVRWIPFARVLNLDDDDSTTAKSPLPSRWIDQAASILENVSGKAFHEYSQDDFYSDETNAPETFIDTHRIGSTAISIQILQCKRTKEVKFEWSRIKESQRDSGLYLQYAYARICGIQRKAGSFVSRLPTDLENVDLLDLLKTSPHAVNIASALANVPGGIKSFGESHDATVLIPHLMTLAKSVSSGHNALFVKDRNAVDLSVARLQLWRATGEVIRNGLRILNGGVEPVEYM
ncbi:UNVERIFIED_CONTAM: hypothetical protein HDU68_009013 [Siphonaria sp. JEL0065]|nr:hypothetical protein HDU68_009013 [Siphonaria sp. JEL0065]